MENIRGCYLPDSRDLKNWVEILNEEVIELFRANKEQQKTLNRVDNFIEQLCSRNWQNQLYTTSTNAYKKKKTDVYLTSEDNDKYFVYVKPGVSNSNPFE